MDQQKRKGLLFAVMIAVALSGGAGCEQASLPEAPAFETLGFDNALPAVHQQMQSVYADWRASPRDAEKNGVLGMHLSTYRKSEAAEIFYRRASLLAPEAFRWKYYLAFTLHDLGRNSAAITTFRDALQLQPEHPEANIELANLLLQDGQLDESMRIFKEISQRHPNRVEGWLGQGKILYRRGESRAALAPLKRAAQTGPEYGEVHFALGEVLRALGNKDEARRAFARYEHTSGNKLRAADELLLEVGALNASDLRPMARGRFLKEQFSLEAAAKAFREAIKINPANQDAWVELVELDAVLVGHTAAEETYRAALAAGINSAALHLAFGQALLDALKLDDARAAFTKAADIDPQSAAAFIALGRVAMLSGDIDAAVQSFRKALEVRPDDSVVGFLLGGALNAAGDHEQALVYLAPIENDPALDPVLALIELATAYRALGRGTEAMDALERGETLAWQAGNIRAADEIARLHKRWQSGGN